LRRRARQAAGTSGAEVRCSSLPSRPLPWNQITGRIRAVRPVVRFGRFDIVERTHQSRADMPASGDIGRRPSGRPARRMTIQVKYTDHVRPGANQPRRTGNVLLPIPGLADGIAVALEQRGGRA